MVRCGVPAGYAADVNVCSCRARWVLVDMRYVEAFLAVSMYCNCTTLIVPVNCSSCHAQQQPLCEKFIGFVIEYAERGSEIEKPLPAILHHLCHDTYNYFALFGALAPHRERGATCPGGV